MQINLIIKKEGLTAINRRYPYTADNIERCRQVILRELGVDVYLIGYYIRKNVGNNWFMYEVK